MEITHPVGDQTIIDEAVAAYLADPQCPIR